MNLHSLLFMWITGRGNIIIIFFVDVVLFYFFVFVLFFFSSRWKALELYLLLWFLYVREKCCLIDKLDKLLWTTLQTRVVIDRSALPSLQAWPPLCKRPPPPPAYRTHHSAGTMGHEPFHCITPRLTSLVHMACRLSLRSKPHPRLSFPCTGRDDTHLIGFTDGITISVLCVCMFMCWQYVLKDFHGQQWQGLVYIFVVNGAILNLIFK